MNKIKNFYRRHKKELIFVGGTLIGASAAVILMNSIIRTTKANSIIVIDPDYYDTLDEAIIAFKELEKTTDFPVISGSFGNYGVFDEAPVIK